MANTQKFTVRDHSKIDPADIKAINDLVERGLEKGKYEVCLAFAVNRGVEVLSKAVFELASEWASQDFKERKNLQTDKDVMSIARSFINSLKNYSSESGGGGYDNPHVAARLERLTEFEDGTPGLLKKITDKGWFLSASDVPETDALINLSTLKKVEADCSAQDRYDVVLNAAIAYWVSAYVKLRMGQPIVAELKEAKDITYNTLFKLSPKEDGLLAMDDFYSAEQIQKKFEDVFRS